MEISFIFYLFSLFYPFFFLKVRELGKKGVVFKKSVFKKCFSHKLLAPI